MAKKKRSVPKSGPVWRKSAVEATLDQMPKFNAHACGTGPHGDAKYNRAKQKRAWQKELSQQGTRDCGSLPFFESGQAILRNGMTRIRCMGGQTILRNNMTQARCMGGQAILRDKRYDVKHLQRFNLLVRKSSKYDKTDNK